MVKEFVLSIIQRIKLKQYDWKRYNISMLVIVIALSCISAYVLSLSGDSSIIKQMCGTVLGLFVVAVLSLIDYHFICRFFIFYYILAIGLVLATKYSPLGTDLGKGAYRWLDLPGFNFQPTEFCKIVVVIALATFFSKMKEKRDHFYTILLAGLVAGIPILGIMNQPDLSSSLVIVFVLVIMIIASGITYKLLIPIAAVGIPSVIAVVWYALQPGSGILESYQIDRIVGFLNPEKYRNSIMFQQLNSVQAIASGKSYGKLLFGGASVSRDYTKVDVTESDFIWAVIGEEFGFIGGVIIITLLMALVIKCLMIAKRSSDYLGMMIAIGIASMFMFQIFANIGVAVCILPNTGLPLPFLSAGLSSMLTNNMIAIGLLMNICIQPAKSISGGFTLR